MLLLILQACGSGGGGSDGSAVTEVDGGSAQNGGVSAPPVTESAEVKAPPRGIFHSAGALRSSSYAPLVRDEYVGKDFVSGTLVRVAWSTVNPAEGEYDFSLIERELTEATQSNSAINLAIQDGPGVPAYVLAQCQTFDFYLKGAPQVTCLPWDSYYLEQKKQLVAALAEAVDEHPNLAAVYITYAAMTNGYEMHWRVDEQDYRDVGYTAETLLSAYTEVMDAYIAGFNKTALLMEVHTVFDEAYLAENAFAHCYDSIGSRCGVAIWWCAKRMAEDPKQLEYPVWHIAQEATQKSFALCQSIASFSDSPDQFDPSMSPDQALGSELDYFISQGISAFESWSVDLENQALETVYQSYISQLAN